MTFLDELERRMQARRTDLEDTPTRGEPRGPGRLRCALFIGVVVLISVVVGLASVGSITSAPAMLVFAHAANLTCSR